MILLQYGLALLASLFCLRFLPGPFVWVSLVWLILLCIRFRSASSNYTRMSYAYLGPAVLAFGIAEAYLWNTEGRENVRIDSLRQARYTVPDDVLGYAPARRNQAHAVKRVGESVVYDVLYTIDSNGVRMSPPCTRDTTDAVLFFGCSFTFGEGVQDTETAAYRTGIRTGGRFHIYNFGFHGYGPHQILARLQSGGVDRAVSGVPRYAIYQGITGQIPRVLGLPQWSSHDPRYVHGKDGHLEHAGRFDDGSAWGLIPLKQLNKSRVFRSLRQAWLSHGDVDLFIDIVDSCRSLFERKYPGSEFHVIFWSDSTEKIGWRVVTELQRRGVRVHPGGVVLHDAKEKYILSPLDGHPNAFAHDAIAEYVATKIVR